MDSRFRGNDEYLSNLNTTIKGTQPMKTSLKGILAIINEEALVLSTYRDAAGVPTIGVGHTAAAGGMAPKQGEPHHH
jgi:GH24 family phage-related lysozyme (muramidase)